MSGLILCTTGDGKSQAQFRAVQPEGVTWLACSHVRLSGAFLRSARSDT